MLEFRKINGRGTDYLTAEFPTTVRSCWTHFVRDRRCYTSLENICSVGSTLMALVTVNVFKRM